MDEFLKTESQSEPIVDEKPKRKRDTAGSAGATPQRSPSPKAEPQPRKTADEAHTLLREHYEQGGHSLDSDADFAKWVLDNDLQLSSQEWHELRETQIATALEYASAQSATTEPWPANDSPPPTPEEEAESRAIDTDSLPKAKR